jgi:hypothetical protein
VELVVVNSRPAGKARRTTFNGRDYLVAPMTLIVPGVVPGSEGPLLYPLEELGRNYLAWNYMPIVVNHPLRAGRHVSAREPSILEESGVGFVFNTSLNDRLRAEGWFDVERTRQVDVRVLDRLERGEPLELSTGLYVDTEAAPQGAVWNTPGGPRPYRAVARNYRPDHLAVLPDQRGACAVDDGCGVLVNQLGEAPMSTISARLGTQLGGFVGADNDWSEFAAWAHSLPPGEYTTVKGLAVNAQVADAGSLDEELGWAAVEAPPETDGAVAVTGRLLAILGDYVEPTGRLSVVANELSHTDLERRLEALLLEKYMPVGRPLPSSSPMDGMNPSPYLVDVYDDYIVYRWLDKTYSLGYEVDNQTDKVTLDTEDPVEVTRVTEYVSVDNTETENVWWDYKEDAPLANAKGLTGGEWVTIKGAHVYLKDGEVVAGPEGLKKVVAGKTKSKTTKKPVVFGAPQDRGMLGPSLPPMEPTPKPSATPKRKSKAPVVFGAPQDIGFLAKLGTGTPSPIPAAPVTPPPAKHVPKAPTAQAPAPLGHDPVSPAEAYTRREEAGANPSLPDHSRPALTAAEVGAVENYGGGGYKKLNSTLIAGKPLMGAAKADDENLQGAFAKVGQFSRPIEVNRGMSLGGKKLRDFLAQFTPGEVTTLRSYTSTTTHPPLGPNRAPFFGGNVSIDIIAHSGLDVKQYLNGKSGHTENELLLNKGSKFKVLGVEKTAFGHRIRLEHIPHGAGAHTTSSTVPTQNTSMVYHTKGADGQEVTYDPGMDPEKFVETDPAAFVFERGALAGNAGLSTPDVTPEKACKILKDGTIRGKELTPRQRGLFGIICGRRKKPRGPARNQFTGSETQDLNHQTNLVSNERGESPMSRLTDEQRRIIVDNLVANTGCGCHGQTMPWPNERAALEKLTDNELAFADGCRRALVQNYTSGPGGGSVATGPTAAQGARGVVDPSQIVVPVATPVKAPANMAEALATYGTAQDREVWNSALAIHAHEKASVIETIVANVTGEARERLIARLQTKNIDELRELAVLGAQHRPQQQSLSPAVNWFGASAAAVAPPVQEEPLTSPLYNFERRSA